MFRDSMSKRLLLIAFPRWYLRSDDGIGSFSGGENKHHLFTGTGSQASLKSSIFSCDNLQTFSINFTRRAKVLFLAYVFVQVFAQWKGHSWMMSVQRFFLTCCHTQTLHLSNKKAWVTVTSTLASNLESSRSLFSLQIIITKSSPQSNIHSQFPEWIIQNFEWMAMFTHFLFSPFKLPLNHENVSNIWSTEWRMDKKSHATR